MRSVFFIRHLIEGRHIDSRQSAPLSLKIPVLAAALCPSLLYKDPAVGIIDRFTLSDIEQIKELCQRLRIVGAGTAADHNRIILGTVYVHAAGSGQIQDLQDIGITHLILDRDT